MLPTTDHNYQNIPLIIKCFWQINIQCYVYHNHNNNDNNINNDSSNNCNSIFIQPSLFELLVRLKLLCIIPCEIICFCHSSIMERDSDQKFHTMIIHNSSYLRLTQMFNSFQENKLCRTFGQLLVGTVECLGLTAVRSRVSDPLPALRNTCQGAEHQRPRGMN